MKESDANLVLRTLNGDKQAYGELYDRYAGLVRAICHDSESDMTRAADLAQEVFFRAYEKLSHLRDPARFGYWLISIARNTCRDYRRGRVRDRHVLVGLNPPELQNPEREWIEDERLMMLHEAFQVLTEKERLALRSYYLEEEDAEKARKIVGVSRSGFYRLLNKARNRIEEYFKHHQGN